MKTQHSPFTSSVIKEYKIDQGERLGTQMVIDSRNLSKLVLPKSHTFPLIHDFIVGTQGC